MDLTQFIPSEEQDKLSRLTFDSGYFVDLVYDEDLHMTFSKARVRLKGIRTFDKKGSPRFFVEVSKWFEKFGGEIINDAWQGKDISELEAMVDSHKLLVDETKEQLAKGIVFDGHRYWWKFKYENGMVELIEKVVI
jgi:hypothetical protein